MRNMHPVFVNGCLDMESVKCPKMRENIARTCHADISQVSVKATTEERLGFTGREEGISAHCVALLERKES